MGILKKEQEGENSIFDISRGTNRLLCATITKRVLSQTPKMGNRINFICLLGGLVIVTYAEVIKNPAIASKCQRMVLKRSNDAWESTHIPSSCSIVNDPEEDAIKVCKEAFPMLYITGVRPIGQELLNGPWCKSNHKDWSKPCKGKPHLAPVWECIVKKISQDYRKDIRHYAEYVNEDFNGQVNDESNDYVRGDFGVDAYDAASLESTKEIKTTPTTTTEPTTSTTTTTTTSTTTLEITTTLITTTTIVEKKDIATGPPALSVPPMCSFRHPQRAKNETCKDAADWRDDAIRTCTTMHFELHSFAPLSTCDNNADMYIGLQFVCCPADPTNRLRDFDSKGENSVVNNEPVAMAIKANNDIQVSRVELQSSPSVAAAAIAVGAAVVLLLTALAVVTVRGRQRVRRERRLASQRPPLSPEERHLQRLQSTGYENPTYRFFEQRQ